jgi:hypothetical protein
MNRQTKKVFRSLIFLASLLSITGFDEVLFAQTKEKSKLDMRQKTYNFQTGVTIPVTEFNYAFKPSPPPK